MNEQGVVIGIWLALSAYFVLTGYLDIRRLEKGDFLDEAEAAQFGRDPDSYKSPVLFGVIIFAIISALVTGAGFLFANVIDFRSAETWSIEFMAMILAPWIGWLCVQYYVSGARWQRSFHRLLRIAVIVAIFSALFPQIRATAYWWVHVDHETIARWFTLEKAGKTSELPPFWWARHIRRMNAYVRSWPNGPQIDRVNALNDELEWRNIIYGKRLRGSSNVLVRYDLRTVMEYLGKFPEGKYKSQALALIRLGDIKEVTRLFHRIRAPHLDATVEPRIWQLLSARNTVRSLLRFQGLYPASQFLAESNRRIEALRQDDKLWLKAANSSSPRAITAFLEQYPGHKNAAQAKERQDGIPLRRLLSENKVQAEFSGCGIKAVCGRMRRLTLFPLAVQVPAGMLMKSNNASYQSMAVTSTARIILPDMKWKDIRLAAGCADIGLKIPQKHVQFTFDAREQDQKLTQLQQALDSLKGKYPVKQAMLWIVRDNATVGELRKRLTGTFYTGGASFRSSVINKGHVHTALQRLKSAGYPAAKTFAARELNFR